jgi:N-methylhydantoinase A
MIGRELDIPMLIVPRESSIFCAAGMLMSDLKHDFVRTLVAPLDGLDRQRLKSLVDEMANEGASLLEAEKIPEDRRRYHFRLDCRYVKQYHEVSFAVPGQAVDTGDLTAIAGAFHAEHERLYGYSLEEQKAPVEIINVRVQAIGITEKPEYIEDTFAGEDASIALKTERRVYVPDDAAFRTVPVYDGHRTRFGHRIAGPAMIEQLNTSVFVDAAFDCVCDRLGSFVVYRRGREDMVAETLRETRS